MPEQLVFDLGRRVAMGRSDFIASNCNALALLQVEDWRNWPEGKLVLSGPKGAGKTHLAHVFASLTGAEVVAGADLTAGSLPLDAPALVIEDLDQLPPDSAAVAEEQAFHLHNALRQRRAPLLLTGRTPPSRWPLRLPDLASRLMAATVARIEAPDDRLLAAVMRKQFRDRQVNVPEDALDYLVLQIERSFAAAEEMVARLDAAALRDGRDVTKRFAAEFLRKSA
ncbi:chromosomal replication initiator DnaA [Algicella marina]|uniref:Chromosomal replication initiator DnaA n=2 Tax=Algicella marina TaxID=2683284 RepID=A0A6P1T6Q5_9RHOB|nr:chromosomal replication initiator DnaA [Algicella marina]